MLAHRKPTSKSPGLHAPAGAAKSPETRYRDIALPLSGKKGWLFLTVAEAMLAYMNDASNPRNGYPAYWAPFVAVGEGAAR